MQNKPANWVTGFKRSPRAANVQNRDMGLFLNSSGKFEPIDDAWDSIHSGGIFISGDNKLYFRDETNKDIYINSPTAETLVLGAGNATTAGFITVNEEGFDTDFRVEASGVANALFVRGSDGNVGIGTDDPAERLEVVGNVNQSDGSPEYHFETTSASHYNWRIACQEDVSNAFEIASGTQSSSAPDDTYTNRLVIKADTGNVGIGATAGTLLELFGTAPYLTLRNSTHENGDGGRESKIIFEGERTGGADSTLAVIQASHDGTGDDEKGDLIFYTNDGSDGAAPTEAMRIDSGSAVEIGACAGSNHPLNVASSGGSNIRLVGRDNGTTDEATLVFQHFDGSTYHGQIQGSSTGLSFWGGSTEAMRIDSSGNVGIGVTDPGTYRLNVQHPSQSGEPNEKPVAYFKHGGSTGYLDSVVTIEAAGHTGTTNQEGALLINNTANGRSGLTVYSDMNASQDKALVRFTADNTGFDHPVLQIQQDGSGPALEVTSGNVGIGATPGTLLELFGTAPYLTLRNSTHENGDGGRESKIIFEGEQSGGADSTLAVIQASHDGTSDDQKGDLIFYTNDGNDNAAPTEAVRIDSGGNVAIGKGAADTGISLNSGSGNDSYINFNEGGSNKSYIRNEGTDDSFRINVASADRVTIDSAGNVNMPYQPAFSAHPASAQNNFAVGSAVDIVFGTERFDQGGDFASSTFTAPVAGKYQLNTSIQLNNIDQAADYYAITIVTSNDSYEYAQDPGQHAGDISYWTPVMTVLADMDASDTAKVTVTQATGTAQTDVWTESWFTGSLIC